MKPVILISSCARDKDGGYHDAIRNTWAHGSAIPYFFILGEGNVSNWAEEVVMYGVPDDYKSLPYKTREGHRWAMQQGFDYIFQCFTDTYIRPERLLASGFEGHDYLGNFSEPEPGFGAYASGGAGYWLSEKASKILCLSEIDHWAEDLWVGRVMGKHKVKASHDPRYWIRGGQSHKKNDAITVHLSQGTDNYSPQWMHQQHKWFLASFK